MSTDDKSGYYLWFDTEFTSLRLEEARLLQVALVITDVNLRRVTAPEEDLVLPVALGEGVAVSAWSEENLGGLLRACRGEEALPVEEVDARLEGFVDRHLGPIPSEERLRPVLAGNSVHSDWWLARKYLPRFSARLHYRHLDVSALKLQWLDWYGGREFDKDDAAEIRRWFPEAGAGPESRPHDALYDVLASIAELAYYREHLFRPRSPGNTALTA